MLKPQDVYLVLGLCVLERRRQSMSVRELAALTGLSVAETSEGLRRAGAAQLLQLDLRQPNVRNLMEFIEHGVRYAFAPEWLPTTRGVPTTSGGPGMGDIKAQQYPVWPLEEGSDAGPGLRPMYPSVPKAALGDRDLHRVMAALDCVRAGRARERAAGLAVLREVVGGEVGPPA